MSTRTFTWDGVAVPWLDDTDSWTAGELRQVEALAGRPIGELALLSVRGLMISLSVARATGRRIAEVDRDLTIGRINRIREELDAQDREERAAAAAEPEPVPSGRVVEFTAANTIDPTGPVPAPGGEVLSPTSAGSEQPPA